MAKKQNIFFIVSKSGKSKSKASFYNEKGNKIPKDDVKITYRSSDTGRFVTRDYKNFIGRDSRSGEFISEKEARGDRVAPKATAHEASKHSARTTSARILKDSPVYFRSSKNKR